MEFIGVNEFTHDIGAAIVTDENLYAFEEERFSRQKHHYGFDRGGDYPHESVSECIKSVSLSDKDIDEVYLSWKTGLIKWYITKAKILRCYKKSGLIHTKTENSYIKLAKQVYKNSISRKKVLKNLPYNCRTISHHLAHASYAYRTSNMDRALVVILDGSGESESGSIYIAENNNLHRIKKYPISQSLGTLYAIITRLIGLGRDAEGKTMGLASLGAPISGIKFVEFNQRADKFNIYYDMVKRCGDHLRTTTSTSEQYRRDIAATLQRDFNETLLSFFRYITAKYGMTDVCFGGGVALNCVFNGQLIRSDIVRNLYIPSAPNDSGVALGAALEAKSRHKPCYKLNLPNAFLGINVSDEKDINTSFTTIASDLYSGKVVAICRGRAELGPRALGNRSILATAYNPDVSRHLNINVKNRELWRPYGIIILDEDVKHLFDVKSDYNVPFMNVTLQISDLGKKIIPGCIHVDGSVRVQTINRANNPYIYNILQAFKKLNGYGVLINTSLNRSGEPIVNTAKEALITFNNTDIDVLYLSGERISKPGRLTAISNENSILQGA